MKKLIRKVLYEEIENTSKQSNFDRLLDKFKENFPDELKSKTEAIKKFVSHYVEDKGYTIKFLNACGMHPMHLQRPCHIFSQEITAQMESSLVQIIISGIICLLLLQETK